MSVSGEQAAPAETLTAAEETFERWRKMVGAVAAPVVFLLVFWALSGTTFKPKSATFAADAGVALSAILAGVGVLWITEALPLPVTALVGAMACILMGVAEAKVVLAPFADPMIFLFLGSFILARAMSLHGLDKRIALGFLSWPIIAGRPGRVMAGMGVITAVISMWVSNTATTAMMLPIALGILAALHEVRTRVGLASGPMDARRWPFATGMLLMIAYSASIGGIGTKVGSPPNLITLGQLERMTGRTMTFFEWMMVMVPMLAVMGAVLLALLYWLHPDRTAARPGADRAHAASESQGLADFLTQERAKLGRWTAGQRNTLIAFAVAVGLWVTPGILSVFAEGKDKKPVTPTITSERTLVGAKPATDVTTTKPIEAASGAKPQAAQQNGIDKALAFFSGKGRLPEASVALLAALLLFILPTDLRHGKFTMSWGEAAKIDWGTLLLFGGGIALGDLMFQTGVADSLGSWAVQKTGANSLWVLVAVMAALGIFLSETTSNTAAATMLAPVAIVMAQGIGVSAVPPALGACLGASFGFMLPVSTPPNAIVFGSGLVPITRMIRAGILFDVLGFVIIVAGLRVLCPLLGLV
ncbi:MAG TPA: SLC13 family permease [Tepidisphaeraceae bacterium]|nr:SLC13 family permease [Tepidisphaeraceae bacterium]